MAQGTRLKARTRSELTVRPGETTGLTFRPDKLSVFVKASGPYKVSKVFVANVLALRERM